MRQKWIILFLLLGAGLSLLAGCTTRTTSTPQTGEPAGPPVQTAAPVVPTAPAAVSQAPAGTAGPAPTPPAALASPQFTAQGTLESGIPWGTTSDGNYFKGDPQAPLIMFEFSDFQ